MVYKTNNPTLTDSGKGGLYISRLAPGNQRVTVDIAGPGDYERLEAVILAADGSGAQRFDFPGDARRLEIHPIWNDVEYQVQVKAYRGEDIAGQCRTRLFRAGYVPGTVVNYIHPEDYTFMPSGRSPASPSIVRMGDRLIASHDVYWGDCEQNLSFVFVSYDDGVSWSYLSQVTPCFWGKLFCYRDTLYIMGMAHEYGAIKLYASTDGGASWSEPATLMEGGDRYIGGPHQAPMPVIEHNGRLWTCIDYGSWNLPDFHKNGFISADVDSDLMDPRSWVCTGFLPYDNSWPGTVCGRSAGCIEGNAVVSPDGRLLNFLRYATNHCAPSVGRALILEADADAPDKLPRFHAIVKFPGNLSKFKVGYDPGSMRYWSLVSRVTGDNLMQRNLLTMVSSEDLNEWRIERDILNFEDNGWAEDSRSTGFQYVDWIIDGEDMLALSRTAINGAYNFHNANYLTFHRIKNFRRRGY